MVGANVGPEVVRPRDRWKSMRNDNNSLRRNLFELPLPVESFVEDTWLNFRTPIPNYTAEANLSNENRAGTTKLVL